MKRKTVIMDFSRIYREEDFFLKKSYEWLDFTGFSGVNGYCTRESEDEIQRAVREFKAEGIHFLDSGNYHYLSKVWLEKIQEPFSLLVFDHHTDMQEAAFFGLLSCGSWIKEVLKQNEMVREVCIMGPCASAFSECEKEDRERILAVEGEKLSKNSMEGFRDFLDKGKELPLYLSIDKDILCKEDARTNWDQGEVTLEQLSGWIREAFKKRKIIGADICGENPQDTAVPPKREDLAVNSRTNSILWELLTEEFEKQDKEL